ncbi:MAG: phospholipase D-like domain-containing protein [Nanobdellota archaeon]
MYFPRRAIYYSLFLLVYLAGLIWIYQPSFLVQTTFSDSGSVDFFSCQDHNCPFLLNTLINESESAYCAFYDIDPDLFNSTLNQTNSLIFEDSCSTELSNHSYISPVSSKGLMHHKFCIFNNKTVLTGTWNPTFTGSYLNDNAIVLVRSQKIAQLYFKEWSRIKTTSSSDSQTFFHPQTPYHVNLSGSMIDVCFSPVQECESLLSNTLKTTKSHLRILSFMFTSDALGQTVINISKNVTVSGVFESSGQNPYSELPLFRDHGLDVLTDANPGFMHEKIFIIDNSTTVMGSYNPTKNARENNDENVLVIHNETFASYALAEYRRIRFLAETDTLEQ